ncbi:unnamed protein product [Protopolystoma xenopodis]|uniref:Uncharacterized protein n=1 Tax=Protopolystoma xenopodis TaxID=117903 RepID=A0A448WII9_9PLAT|nr:unnamed protein product [Protopolystoma xenopodis]
MPPRRFSMPTVTSLDPESLAALQSNAAALAANAAASERKRYLGDDAYVSPDATIDDASLTTRNPAKTAVELVATPIAVTSVIPSLIDTTSLALTITPTGISSSSPVGSLSSQRPGAPRPPSICEERSSDDEADPAKQTPDSTKSKLFGGASGKSTFTNVRSSAPAEKSIDRSPARSKKP